MNADDEARIAGQLGSLTHLPEGWAIDVRASCTSTNSLLLEDAGGAPRVLVALEQTAGRGRRGRAWTAHAGDSLTFSLRYRFAVRADALAGLSLVVGVALADALAAGGSAGIALKWPNDLMRAGGKLGGVLIELTSAQAGSTTAVIGVGINLALPPSDHYACPPAALFDLTPDRERWLVTAAALIDALAAALPLFAEGGFAAFADRWNHYNLHAGQPVTVSGERLTLHGICIGADRDGALLLDTGHGIERVLAGDVSLRAGG